MQRIAISLLLWALLPGVSALAQEWPTKPVKWVVPYAPGGASDVLARILAQQLSERLSKPVVIENKAGAGGNIGTDYVAKSAPDGYTIVLGNIGPISVSQSLYSNLPYDPEKDLAPITLLMAYANVLVVSPTFPHKTLKEFIQFAKSQTTPVSYATPGVATSLHLAAELFAKTTGVRMTHVPYKGGTPALNDVMGGHIPLAFDPMASTLPHVKSGKLRALAVTSSERSALLPDVPTVAESGYPGFEVIGWIGLLAPKNTPQPAINRLVREFTTIMNMPDIRHKVADMGSFVPTLGPDHFAKFIHTEAVKWGNVVRSANIKPQ